MDYRWNLVPVDGTLGETTTEALKAFQQFQYMKPTGKMDTATREKLDDTYRWSLCAAQVNSYGSYDYQSTLRPSLAPRSLPGEGLLRPALATAATAERADTLSPTT